MKKEILQIVIVAIVLGGCACNNLPNNIAKNNKDFKLRILHINDTHSHLEPTRIKIKIDGKKTYVYAGGYAKIAKFIKNKKALDSHTIALHAGDAVQGTLYYTLFDAKADIETLNKMDIDAMTIGNHEFDKGADSFGRNFANNADFAIISCDIDASKNKTLKNIIKPYIIKKIDNENIAIVGDSLNSSVISNPGPTIEFSNYIKSANKYIDILKKENINKIIFLTHIGFENDKILAKQVKDIDVIVGGHSHTLLGDFLNLGITSDGKYPTIIDHKNSKTLIVSAWKWGEVVGDLSVVFDEKGAIKSYSGTPIMLVDDKFLRKNKKGKKVKVDKETKKSIESIIASAPNIKIEAKDSSIIKIINKFKPKVDELMHKVVAKASDELINVRLPGSYDTQSGKFLPNGSMIAPLVALAIFEKAKEAGGCDFALQNAGGVRISIPKGDVTIGEIYTLLPFGNTLVTLKMSGKDIKTMLENAIDRSLIKKDDTGAFPYLANAKFTINIDNLLGSRIAEFKLKDKDGNWVNVDRDKIYTIATNSYIASGGDYYKEMKKSAFDKVDSGYVDAETFLEYVKNVKILSPLSKVDAPVKLTNLDR